MALAEGDDAQLTRGQQLPKVLSPLPLHHASASEEAVPVPPGAGQLVRAKSEGCKLLATLDEACEIGGHKQCRTPSAHGKRPSSREVAEMVRALEVTATRVENLATQLQEDRADAAKRELRIAQALEALAVSSERRVATPQDFVAEKYAVDKFTEVIANREEHLLAALRTVLGVALPEAMRKGPASSPSDTEAGCVHPAPYPVTPPEVDCPPKPPPLLDPLLDEEVTGSPAITPRNTPQSMVHPKCPDYKTFIGRDGREYEHPQVEVSIKVYQVSNVNTASLTYEVDLVCHLDWFDPNVAGFSDEDLRTLDWQYYFNPYVDIDNCKDNSGWLKGADELPRRFRPCALRRSSRCSFLGEPDSSDIVNSHSDGEDPAKSGSLRKTMRFRGTLALSSVSLRCFPFDVQLLPIRLKAARCRSIVATPRDSAVVAPMLPGSPNSQRVFLVDSITMMQDEGYRRADHHLRGRGHFAVPAAGDSLVEFEICSVTGCHPDPERGDVYEVSILVERPLSHYIYDVLIMNLLVGLAACAFWDTASADLSSRMSISLTIILTLAAYTSTRPAPIEKAPYVTFHDWCEQMSMFLVTGISIQNVVAVTICGGFHEEAPPYMTEVFEKHQEQCSVGWCLSRKIDCQGLLVLLCTWVCFVIYSIYWLVIKRRVATRGLRNRLHPDGERALLKEGVVVREASNVLESSFGSSAGSSIAGPSVLARDLSILSSDSLGSWTFRLWRCCYRSSALFWQFCGDLCSRCLGRKKLLLRTSPQVTEIHRASEMANHYTPAMDSSPSKDTSSIDHLRGRPRPLDLASDSVMEVGNWKSPARVSLPGLFGPSSLPSSPVGSQTKGRARACPSTPGSIQPSPNATKVSYTASPTSPLGMKQNASTPNCRLLSSSPRQMQMGRGYSQMCD